MSSADPNNPIGITPEKLASLDAVQAAAIFKQGKDAVVFALLAMAKQLAQSQSVNPATPSGMIPVYPKPPAKKRKKKPGAKANHSGSRRAKPDRIDHQQTHRAQACPTCGGELNRCSETRVRYIEDIPETQPETTEHTIHRDWCPDCKKKVEAPVTDALPGSTLGLRVLVFSAWLHYCPGNTLSQIVEVFNFHLQLKLSAGGLIQMWYRLQELLFQWYEQIRLEALGSAVHLLRELEQTLKYKSPSENWPAFEKKLRRLLGDAIRLWKNRDELEAGSLNSRRKRLDKRLTEPIETDGEDTNAKRLIKRLRRHKGDLFTFLDKDGVPFENNHAERSIRPAVIIRKNSYGNRSEQGADCQAVLMSVFRTLKQRNRTTYGYINSELQAKKLRNLERFSYLCC